VPGSPQRGRELYLAGHVAFRVRMGGSVSYARLGAGGERAVSGAIGLHGGGEFMPGDERFLAALLRAARPSPNGAIKVVVVPSAAAHGRPHATAALARDAFERVAREGCRAFMLGYQSMDGVPITVNDWLLNDVLRGEWGFDGLVMSDWFGTKASIRRKSGTGASARRTGAAPNDGLPSVATAAPAMPARTVLRRIGCACIRVPPLLPRWCCDSGFSLC